MNILHSLQNSYHFNQTQRICTLSMHVAKASVLQIRFFLVKDIMETNVFISCEILLTLNRSPKRYIHDTSFSLHRRTRNFHKIGTGKRISRQVSVLLVETATMAQSSRGEFPTWISKRQAASKASVLADKRIRAEMDCLAHQRETLQGRLCCIPLLKRCNCHM